ncbi:glutamine synthetase [Clostridium tepidiprofundi DSM 19306]|uniref:glutamine synthetase n=1 Tax=Clostridium tepidiprofundi DSM 19306 TaxID=1121338 RepID=A0A151B5P9_9CLOT|nr:glutamine synthetase [Clostridium tepidiprofundi]KYH34977.1 glutamine synthetase [Clostridium tepidiprofundi DSM 19306]
MIKDLVYVIPKEKHSEKDIRSILERHSEIKFVSLVGVDLSGNDTDEKIPIKIFLDDIYAFLKGAVQTDGSSVVLPGIATLNDAKLDMVPDVDCNWFIDYNYENIDPKTNNPIGTLKIPCFLYHNNNAVDSRSILKNSIKYFKSKLLHLFKTHPHSLKAFNINYDDIEDISLTSATELEFWVKTPNDEAHVEQLSTSQVLKEQYWTRTKGSVRTALEQSLILLENYGLEPEMGHKEVGGVKAQLDKSGMLTHIMEQLEIDWKYSNAIQAADNELFVRNIVKETFRRNGLDVTFLAKPINNVAGSGEHTHIGVAAKLKNGKIVNLFTAPKDQYMSIIGYGALMGILKNYEIINPFISATNDSLRRLKPGFEAPVCTVTSIGYSPEVPSRNRTVLIGLIRDMENTLASRFELRSPNPHTNTYLVLASMYMCMIDGINYAISSNKSENDLLTELSKNYGENADYLEKNRAYRSEKDIFEDFTDEERTKLFGKAPQTVFENLKSLDTLHDKLNVLKQEDIFNENILNSYKLAILTRWITEISNRIINDYRDEIRKCKMLHNPEKAIDLDAINWQKIDTLRHYIMKDTYSNKSLFTRINEAIDSRDYELTSILQIELDNKMNELRHLYDIYVKNLLL